MGSNKEADADPRRTYDDFEPFCQWYGHQKVEVHVEGFKKEHLSVQTNKHKGIVTIHGARPLTLKETDSTTWRWSRFHKEIIVAETCDINEVRANLAGVVLTVTMPDRQKVSITTYSNIDTPNPNPNPNPNPTTTRTITQKEKVDVPPAAAAAAHHDQHNITFTADDEKHKPAAATSRTNSSIATLVSRFEVLGKDVALVLKLVVAVSVVVAFGFGAYFVKYYKHRHPY